MIGVLLWQLFDLTPARWCVVAKQGSPDLANSCVTMLIKLLDVKDHVMIGLLGIVGLAVMALTTVALGVKIDFNGPGGISGNFSRDEDSSKDT